MSEGFSLGAIMSRSLTGADMILIFFGVGVGTLLTLLVQGMIRSYRADRAAKSGTDDIPQTASAVTGPLVDFASLFCGVFTGVVDKVRTSGAASEPDVLQATRLINDLRTAGHAGQTAHIMEFDWKDEATTAAAEFDRLYTQITRKNGHITRTVGTCPAAPEHLGVHMALQAAIPVYGRARYTLLSIEPPSPGDSYLIGAADTRRAADWRNTDLLPTPKSKANTAIRIRDAAILLKDLPDDLRHPGAPVVPDLGPPRRLGYRSEV